MPADEPPSGSGPKSSLTSQAKGLVESLSAGARQLVVLDDKLTALGKEDDRLRELLTRIQGLVDRLGGIVEQMEKRFSDRFGDLDKRLAEMDKRLALQIEVSVRNEVEKWLGPKGPNPPNTT